MTEYGDSGQPIDWQKYMLYLKLYTLETKIFFLNYQLKIRSVGR
jgi:hypothetical protein